jgi:hypothetical protein
MRKRPSLWQRIRQSVEAEAFPNPESRVSRRVTLSIGVAVQTTDEAISPEQLQRRADEALYLAKQTGRNRVLLHKPDSAERKRIQSTHGEAIDSEATSMPQRRLADEGGRQRRRGRHIRPAALSSNTFQIVRSGCSM